MANVAFTAAELIEQRTKGVPQRLERAGQGFAQHGFQLGKDLFDGSEHHKAKRVSSYKPLTR